MSTLTRFLKLSRPADAEEELLERLRRQVRQDPRSLQFVPLADLCRKRSLFDEAVTVCLQGLSHHPGYVSGLVALARTYHEAGDLPHALEVYQRVVERAPDNLVGHLGLGELCEQTGQLVAARDQYRRAFQLGASSPELVARLQRIEHLLLEEAASGGAGSPRAGGGREARRERLLRQKRAMLLAWSDRFRPLKTP